MMQQQILENRLRGEPGLSNVYPEFELILIGRGLFNLLSKTVVKVIGREAAKTGGKELFKFGGSAGRHMADKNRAVPVQILEQAIKGSKGIADPKGSRALMHTTEMFKNGRTYNLEVFYDKATNTIWHFKYWPK